jgi:mono/diheme cytochrome c family protein
MHSGLIASDEPTKPDPNDPALTSRGKVVYAEHCASCHGANLEGQPNWRNGSPTDACPPHRTTRPGTLGTTRTGNCSRWVKNGTAAMMPGYETDMPAYKEILSDADIWAVLSYIESTGQPAFASANNA